MSIRSLYFRSRSTIWTPGTGYYVDVLDNRFGRSEIFIYLFIYYEHRCLLSTWPLCKLWEHRFSVPGLASIPPPPCFVSLVFNSNASACKLNDTASSLFLLLKVISEREKTESEKPGRGSEAALQNILILPYRKLCFTCESHFAFKNEQVEQQ